MKQGQSEPRGATRESMRRPGRTSRLQRAMALAAAGAASVLIALTVAAPAASALPLGCSKVRGVVACPKVSYRFQTLNDPADVTFNQLLGINKQGVIAGYFGSGVQGHPNRGYLLFPPYFQNYYADNNFLGSVQTQVTGINDNGVLVGFDSSMNNANQVNDNHGWYKLHGQFFPADFPTTSPASPPVDQLLGVNDKDQAVGFFTDATAVNHGYEFDISSGQYKEITVSGFSNITTSGINNQGDIVGFGTASDGNTHGFLLTKGGSKVTELSYSGAASTQPLGVSNNDEVVGVATIGSGNSAKMVGFTYYPGYGFKTINAPHGNGTTTINGVNSCGDLVGFYVDGAGNTDGLLANAQFSPTASSANASAARAGKKAKKGKTKKVKTVLPKGC
jgi:probable HAF family extracellular repeat protein